MAFARTPTYITKESPNVAINENFDALFGLINEYFPVIPISKNANLIKTKNGIDTSQNISTEGTPYFKSVGAGVQPKQGQSFTIKAKTDIGTDVFSPNFRTGEGWGVMYEDGEYTQYIDNLQINGWLKAKEFIIEQTKLRDANYLFTNSAQVKSTNGTTFFDVEDPNENGVAPFEANDIILCLQVNLTGASYTAGEIDDDPYLIKRLIFKVDSVSGTRVTLTSAAGAPTNKGTIKKGDVFARIGNTTDSTRQGLVGIFNDEENAPYFDIRTGLSSYSAYKSDSNIQTRIGKLDGINDASFADLDGTQTDWFGNYFIGNTYIKGNAFIEGSITLTNQISSSDISDVDAYSTGQDEQTLSTLNYDTPSGSGFYLDATHLGYYSGAAWTTYMDNTGNFYLGGTSGSLQWTSGTLTIDGNVFSGSISSSATITGGILQTASSGARVVIGTSNDIRFYNSSGIYKGALAGGVSGIVFDNNTEVQGSFTVSGAFSAGSVSSTEFGYLNGVTSDIQTQLNGKAASSHTHSTSDITSGQLGLAYGGTGSGSGSFSTFRVVITNGTPVMQSSSITTGELGYLSGLAQNVETALNSKASSTWGSPTGIGTTSTGTVLYKRSFNGQDVVTTT